MNALLSRVIPSPIKDVLRPCYRSYQYLKYGSYLRQLRIDKKQLLILATITKTGTHYLRFLLANYVKLLNDPADPPVRSKEIDVFFPNAWHKAYRGPNIYQKPTRLLGLIGLHDVPRSHIEYQHPYWDESRVIHLYRNPLDYAVALYIYKYEYDEKLTGTIARPVEVLERHLGEFVSMYLSYRDAARSGNATLLRISYEDLVRYPQLCLGTILRWIGVEPSIPVVEAASEYASQETTALIGAGEAWQRDGTLPANDQVNDFTAKFARAGSVGEWKEFFSPSDVDRIGARLSSTGIDLDEFTLEI